MRKLAFSVGIMSIVAFTSAANAACYGSSSYQNCTDDYGNSYSVQRYGNTTQLNGYNSQTGSSWNQNSQTIGNTTYHNGTSADGNNWNMTQQRIGNNTFYSGTDSNGNSINKTCNQFGCF